MRHLAVLVGMVALSLVAGAPGRAEDVPPPPPMLVPEEGPPEAPPEVIPPPVEPEVVLPPKKLPPPEASAPVVVETHVLPGAARGALAGAAGAVVGAGTGAALLFWGALAPEVPEIALLVVGAATPAVAAFFGGSSVLAFVVDSPTAEDWGSVAACTAVGCLAVGLAVLGGQGGVSVGTGCGTGACGDPFGGSRSSGGHAAVWGTAGSGIGTALGLGAGALTGLLLAAGEPSGSVNGPATIAVSAGIGSLIGAAAGGAIGGAIGGHSEEESATFRSEAPPARPRR